MQLKSIEKLKLWFEEKTSLIKKYHTPTSLELIIEELHENEIISDLQRTEIEIFASKYELEEILKNTAIMTGLISAANAATLGSQILPNIAGMAYMYSQVPKYIKNKKGFMTLYTLNPFNFFLNLGVGSVGYYQQIYLYAKNRDVMKFISYAGITSVMELLKRIDNTPVIGIGTKLMSIFTKIAGVDTIQHYDRLQMAKKIFGHNGDKLSSLMYVAQVAYYPYNIIGKPFQWATEYIMKKFSTAN